MNGSLQGKVALVTGASSGIGEAAARELARRNQREHALVTQFGRLDIEVGARNGAHRNRVFAGQREQAPGAIVLAGVGEQDFVGLGGAVFKRRHHGVEAADVLV